ncbi:transcriptional regulator [Mycobacterium tuberculosis]|nr:transcriptional regulator [Mycobacterium tuberculosis]
MYAYDALELLRPNGFSARRLDGGFSEWLAADLPVVRT